MPISHGFVAASVYAPATGTLVQDGGLDADATTFESNSLEHSAVDPYGNLYYGGDSFRLMLRMRDSDFSRLAQLRTWKNAGTLVRAACAAPPTGGRNVQWYNSSRINKVKPITINGRFAGDARFVDVELVHEGAGAAIYSNVNLLAGPFGWVDAGANGQADNYEFAQGTGHTFSAGVQTLTNTSNVTTYVRARLAFPIAGVTLTLSHEVTNGNAGAVMNVASQTFAEASLAASSNTSLATNARHSAAVTTLATQYQVECFLYSENAVATSSFAFKEPALRVDGGTVYTTY